MFKISYTVSEWGGKKHSAMPLFTFSDAECVVSAGDKVIKCNEEVRVTLGRPKQVLFGAPAHRLCQCGRVQAERPVESFWRKMRGKG